MANIMKGFFEGRGGAGEPSGRVVRVLSLRVPERKEEKLAGVREVASAGGGRPVILAISVRIHRRMAKMPRTEPRVFRRLPNCSATLTIAVRCYHDEFLKGWLFLLTEKR